MSDDGSKQDQSAWPLPKFYFRVRLGDTVMKFQEVSGLDTKVEPLEYRAGNSKIFAPVKMPGMKAYSNVTLKKGVFEAESTFWDWFKQLKMNTISGKTVTISLIDESGAPTMTWTLSNAYPVKITGTDMKADGNTVAVETIELAHEGVTIANR